ncbi:hypothetical protein KUTeg_013941 [Tegillarca granosa]|uniref:Uncharacterized protein n=1 Tax=Tegillarca granosa TaxID=220873 RepID=A0ABQ9EV56_TEGGR|nr:hypothetical protein KUTeg_013941 [Tegillarca granosa]
MCYFLSSVFIPIIPLLCGNFNIYITGSEKNKIRKKDFFCLNRFQTYYRLSFHTRALEYPPYSGLVYLYSKHAFVPSYIYDICHSPNQRCCLAVIDINHCFLKKRCCLSHLVSFIHFNYHNLIFSITFYGLFMYESFHIHTYISVCPF